jgi:Ca-activated chloride channel family protein
MPETFHFQHPEWFLLLLPLLLLWWRVRRPGVHDSPWRRLCDARLLPYLLVNRADRAGRLPAWLLAGGWLLTVIALADPVWDRQPQPVFRSQDARVVVLDLSNSMLAADLPPSRLVRARYKVADILDRSPDGQTGLVVFAGDAFTVAPLSNDTDTIRSLLQPLEPGLMPVQGSRVDLGLTQAMELLTQAGQARGDVLLITDGYTGKDALQAARTLHAAGYRLSVLGVGTAAGAPLSDGQGGYLRDASGNIVMPQLDTDALRELAAAGGGHYAGISGTDQDIRYLLADLSGSLSRESERTDLTTNTWQSRGPWLVLLLLPLAALVFRRGWLLVLVLQVGTGMGLPRPAMALGWDDLWLRPDQQAARSLQAGAPAEAAQLAKDPGLRGTGAYLSGDYEQALTAFAATGGPDGDYNQGNSLAQLGRYEEAIAAYDRALAAQPDMEDAVYNKAQIEKLLQQQQQEQQQAAGQQKQEQDQQQSGEQQEQGQDQQPSAEQQEQGQNQQPSAEQQEQGNDQPQSGSQQAQQQSAEPQEQGEGQQQEQQPGGQAGQGAQDSPSSTSDQEQASQPPSPDRPEAGPETPEAAAGGFPHSEADTAPENQENSPASDVAAEGDDQDNEDQQEAATEQQQGVMPGEEEIQASSPAPAKTAALDSEEQQAAEQWLRRIPDDPGGLLRRKFLYQYRQRAGAPVSREAQAW